MTSRTKDTRKPVPPELFGIDHHSTLLYAETRCVDHSGRPKVQNMRCDERRHPGLAHLPAGGRKHPTRLADGSKLHDHDDWDCIDDMAAAGLIEVLGTDLHPLWRLTSAGWSYVHRLRRERAERQFVLGATEEAQRVFAEHGEADHD